MMGLITAIHVIACLFLIIIILIQTGRGGGLVDSFSGIESMFGTKTNAFLTRTTSVLATIFLITCVSLAVLSSRQHRSLMKDLKIAPQKVVNQEATGKAAEDSSKVAEQNIPNKTEEKSVAEPTNTPLPSPPHKGGGD